MATSIHVQVDDHDPDSAIRESIARWHAGERASFIPAEECVARLKATIETARKNAA